MSFDTIYVHVDVNTESAEERIKDLRAQMNSLCEQMLRVSDAVAEVAREVRSLPIAVSAPRRADEVIEGEVIEGQIIDPPPTCAHGCATHLECKGLCDPFVD